MWCNSLPLAVLFFSLLTQGLADVIDVNVSGRAGGSGSVWAECRFTDCRNHDGGGTEDQESFTLGGSNNQIGTFQSSGFAVADDRVTLSGLVQQATAAFPNSVSVDLLTSATLDAFGREWSDQFQLDNSYSLAFTLTTASLMHLTIQQTGNEHIDNEGFFCSSFDGPDPDAFVLSSCKLIEPGELDQSFIVAPGTYTLNVRDELRYDIGQQGFQTDDQISNHFSLTADFTTVPEPRWTIIVPALICTLWALVLRQRHAPPFKKLKIY